MLLKIVMNPDIEREWKVGSSVTVVFFCDWTWGPQLASARPASSLWWRGKWMFEESSLFLCILNEIPLSIVPFRYRRMCLQWLRCPMEGSARYFERILVTVARSGLVETASHWNEPTRCCNSRVRCACCECWYVSCGMESVVMSVLYGVGVELTAGLL